MTGPSQRNMARNNNFLQTTGTLTSMRSRTPIAALSKLSKQDFEMGFIVQSKGDRELVYVARKKTSTNADTGDVMIFDADTISMATSTLPVGENYTASIIVTMREVAKRRLDAAQIRQLKDSAIFLAQKHEHENLLRVWDIFWDDKKVYFVHEPAVRSAQLVPLPTDSGNTTHIFAESQSDFIKKFQWQETTYHNGNFSYIDHSDENAELRREQDYLRKQLHNKVTQMVSLYKHLLDDHCLKNVHIKPQNILESSTSSLKVYHLDTSTKVSKQAGDLDGLILSPKEAAPGRVDLQDLALFIFYLCTRERLLEEKNDFNEGVVKGQIRQFLDELNSKSQKSLTASSLYGKVEMFRKLPKELRTLMEIFLDYERQARFESWDRV